MAYRPGRKKRSRGGCLLLLFFVVVVAGIYQVQGLLDRIFLPWAFERDGRPALTGTWVGSLTTATGQPRGILFELRRAEPTGTGSGRRRRQYSRYASYGRLEGAARICDEQGQVRSFTLDGKPEDRQATRFNLHAKPTESPVPQGLTPNWMKGAWDQADRLELGVTFHWAKDGGAISGEDYPDTQGEASLNMTRASEAEFEAVCARVKQR